MTRPLFSRSAHGHIIRSLQEQLQNRGFYPKAMDGEYGPVTEQAVEAFQARESLPVTGSVDDSTWNRPMNAAVPSVFERSLQLTASFEGHGFTRVQGNWDGAWLTWGIIGFTLKDAEVGSIILEVQKADPGLLPAAFGTQAEQLLRIIAATAVEQQVWANSITSGTSVTEPWFSGFRKLGESPLVRAIQIAHAAQHYFGPARKTAASFNLRSELGLALCFDIHVQNGGINRAAHQAISQRLGANLDELPRRLLIANAVADAAVEEFRVDVRARKVALANGSGTVHGEALTIACWGLGEFPAVV